MDKYFQKPMFNWFFKWGIVNIKVIDVYYHDCDIRPYMHCTNVVWLSKRTGRVVLKKYNYKID